MSSLVGVTLAELFLFVPSCDTPHPTPQPPPTQRLDCTTWQS